ncbi:pantetheine-phosphate adenylyltransferase [Facklamia miroungae]|uniref:Phosphopantetheine adenylyltransferase n=1 Tax=Facklamia miroungae TaxID=120956 RepID=A0A1G7U4K8_9LACT|nr:pantetheine-phosphate adenylyltransferase [Facklamia miroungae]NKZ29916.1 pantetheine-phosphate adenylyltransferase [Facklamia miroungae]SDG42575.1 Phosphopantetheine adenylyltransferase [Facklamia miroungae]
MVNKIGIFAGSFDPLTYGHLDLIERSTKLFDEVIVLIAVNTTKKTVFTVEERKDLIEEVTQGFDNLRIDYLKDGLIAKYYQKTKATSLIRGVRSAQDFEYEANIAMVNRTQLAGLETILLLANEKYRYLSSSLIKEIAHFGGDISQMVPPNVAQALFAKMQNK